MPSPVRRRIVAERLARAAAWACLGGLVWVIARGGAETPVAPVEGSLDSALVRATRSGASVMSPGFASLPSRVQREWLRALRAAGTDVTWHETAPLPRLALSVEAVPGPAPRHLVTVLASGGDALALTDRWGVLDSVTSMRTEVRTWLGWVSGPVEARVQASVARATPPAHEDARAVLVLARAGWEGKFVAAALEEAGWMVETDFLVTPSGSPAQTRLPPVGVRTIGARSAIDTARFAAVVVLDESAADRAASLARFVTNGGGMVLGPAALDRSTLAGLAPASAGASRPGTLGRLASDAPREGLSARALRPRGDAVTLETRSGQVTLAARRLGRGRVLALGYQDSWRWRMQGGESAPAEHREWWSQLVSAAAASRLPLPSSDLTVDPVPSGALLRDLGPPVSSEARLGAQNVNQASGWLFGLCMLLLLAEWTSRRARGAP